MASVKLPRTPQAWLMFGLAVVIVLAVIFRWPAARAAITGT